MTKKKKKFRKGITQRRGPFYNRGIGNNNNNKNNDAPQLEWYEEFLVINVFFFW
jgi:hypothetical protein